MRKEKRQIEDFKTVCSERFDSLETSLKRAEQNITILHAKWASNQQSLSDLEKQILPTQEFAHKLASRLMEMEEWENGVWSILKELREDMHELSQMQDSEGELPMILVRDCVKLLDH